VVSIATSHWTCEDGTPSRRAIVRGCGVNFAELVHLLLESTCTDNVSERKRQDVTVDGSPQINKRLRVRDPDGKEDGSDNESSGGDFRPTTRGKVKSKSAYSWCDHLLKT